MEDGGVELEREEVGAGEAQRAPGAHVQQDERPARGALRGAGAGLRLRGKGESKVAIISMAISSTSKNGVMWQTKLVQKAISGITTSADVWHNMTSVSLPTLGIRTLLKDSMISVDLIRSLMKKRVSVSAKVE
ncbi:UNVERIFIED_CONTAM: hypothetical protein K2H54_053007 [Gekko kuhli]